MNIVPILALLSFAQQSYAIWCYRCTSAIPGCGEEFNWRPVGYLGEQCPEDDDICIKIVEERGARKTITRDCLSALRGFRTDIPPDHYEGCRSNAKDVRLAHYVNHSISQLDVRRDYFTGTTFCFCFLDHRCNSAPTLLSTQGNILMISLPISLLLVLRSFYKI